MQMNASHPGAYLPPGYSPEYPSAAFQASPGHIGYPTPHTDNSETQDENPVPQNDYPKTKAENPCSKAGNSKTQAEYPGPKAGYTGTQTDYLIDQIQIHQQIELTEAFVEMLILRDVVFARIKHQC
ncbi:Phospholipid scramblase 1 [Camelus dromedarius]|uniref:Phospholipid scramblase 1 n=1 Tax=Camelus dromedarius TaxID=9838 RepID=A0A5N4EJY4_CAMDR|nr:Phospholipid scramblase 1 [Camelus dromedarius]